MTRFLKLFCRLVLPAICAVSFNWDDYATQLNAIANSPHHVAYTPKKFWVKKLAMPSSEGHTLIVKAEFYPDDRMQQAMEVQIGSSLVEMKDDGVYPDDAAGDHAYSLLLKENIATFSAKVQQVQQQIQQQVYLMYFEGNVGYRSYDLPTFDFAKFNTNEFTEFNQKLIAPADCEGEIKKQHSLFITELSVV
jgi:hypothetical protein